ncbi:MAG: phosphoenolpyruvate-utilizing N-terminal domain-containing protein, partial [Pirellulaceae bacterium]
MRILQGLPASPGVAIGEALIIDDEGFRIPRRYIQPDGVAEELHRLEKAVDAVGREIQRNSTDVTQQLGEQYGAIFAAHLQLLRDPSLQSELTAHIRDERYTSEYAVRTTLHRYANAFRQLGNAYLAERAHDILDIERSLLRQLLGESRRELSRLASPAILLAHDLTPSETATLRRGAVLGFATEMGGANSHTAIVAKGLEIPAVVGLGDFLTELAEGDRLIVDGDHGRVIVNPDEDTLSQYRHEVEQHRSRVVQLGALRDLPAQTADGVGIELHANIEFPRDVQTCLERGANGIGLYRTEFLYLGAESEPTE